MKFLIAAGGTGGHINPALAVAEELRRRYPDAQILFVGTKKALLVDSLNVSAPLSELVKNVTELPVMLVNTHADPDHITCNDQFEAAYMHPAEFALYRKNKKKNDAPAMPLWNGDIIDLGGRTVRWLRLERLIKSDDPSAFPALRQFEVYGHDL